MGPVLFTGKVFLGRFWEMLNKRRLGSQYERIAEKILVHEGYTVLDRNFRTSHAEIDLIARDGVYLVFVEVKYRRDESFGGPLLAVTVDKQKRICQAADIYLMLHHLPYTTPVRFDVIGFLGRTYKLVRDAFPYRR